MLKSIGLSLFVYDRIVILRYTLVSCMYIDNNVYHIVPVADLREHLSSPQCWCKPVQDDQDPNLWLHNSMDRREEYERGRKPS